MNITDTDINCSRQPCTRNGITFCICNFNTTSLTNACIRSTLRHVDHDTIHKIIILDNSNVDKKFILDNDLKRHSIEVLDNTTGQIVDFDSILSANQHRLDKNAGSARFNYASLKHARSIQHLIDICSTDFMVLLDSDALLKRDIDFIDDTCITVADVDEEGMPTLYHHIYPQHSRFAPFIQFFNVKKIKESKIKYFCIERIHGIMTPSSRELTYDTGASFYEDVVKADLPYKRIHHEDYVYHLNHGSWNSSHISIKMFEPLCNDDIIQNVDIDNQCIVAFATHEHGLKYIERTCQHILSQKADVIIHPCITLDIDDILLLAPEQLQFLYENNVEVIAGNRKIYAHNSYFFVMQKYRDMPIVIIDDDVNYPDDIVQMLYDNYVKYPKCISSTRSNLIAFDEHGHVKEYQSWKFNVNNCFYPSHQLYVANGGATLYPPDILKISCSDLLDIHKSLHAHNMFLKMKALRLSVKIVRIPVHSGMSAYPNAFDSHTLSYGGNNVMNNNTAMKELRIDDMFKRYI